MSAAPGLEEASFEAFHACTSGPLWGYLRRIAGDSALADDALQESYLRYLTHPPLPASGERERRAYLFRIATNLVRDRWRREQRERLGLARILLGQEGRWTQGPQTGEAGDPTGLDLDAAFARLRPRDRAVLWLACVEGYEHREIGKILNLREASIRVLLFRARKKMMQDLELKR
jgi:RNA polymerase sigma-70 factor, ECF subfamily